MSRHGISLCENCLIVGAYAVSVKYRADDVTLGLCNVCAEALVDGDFATLAEREADKRLVERS